jgi:hypothetical protein
MSDYDEDNEDFEGSEHYEVHYEATGWKDEEDSDFEEADSEDEEEDEDSDEFDAA